MSMTRNQKVIVWARGKLGQQVGRGECWHLADKALRQAGARSSATTGEDDDYDWGTPVDLDEVQPGDILQFRNFVVITTTRWKIAFTDGLNAYEEQEVSFARPHHTAIVDTVGAIVSVHVLEQNVAPKGKRVQRNKLYTQNVQFAWKVTNKKVRHPSGQMMPAKVMESVTITVRGKIWAYRPATR